MAVRRWLLDLPIAPSWWRPVPRLLLPAACRRPIAPACRLASVPAFRSGTGLVRRITHQRPSFLPSRT